LRIFDIFDRIVYGDNVKKMMIRFIKWYQSAFKGKNPTCKYHPSCSNYAVDAYSNHNFVYASLLTVWRILRCNPFSKGGFDPIPKFKKQWKEEQKKSKQNDDN
jgi:putative membrane protein insertion efficiency factor